MKRQQPSRKRRDASNSREPSAVSTPEKCAYNSSNAGNSRMLVAGTQTTAGSPACVSETRTSIAELQILHLVTYF